MKTNTQIPNMLVYGVLFGVVFGISIWLLVVDNESPTNWLLYVIDAIAVCVALVHFAIHSRKTNKQSA